MPTTTDRPTPRHPARDCRGSYVPSLRSKKIFFPPPLHKKYFPCAAYASATLLPAPSSIVHEWLDRCAFLVYALCSQRVIIKYNWSEISESAPLVYCVLTLWQELNATIKGGVSFWWSD